MSFTRRELIIYYQGRKDTNFNDRNVHMVKCGFCNNNNFIPVFHSGRFIINKCTCGTEYPNPRLTDKAILELYNTDLASGESDYLEVERDNKTDFERRLVLIEKYLPIGTLLDVGTNIGSLMEVAIKRGWVCSGVEVNKQAIKIAKAKGLEVSDKSFLDRKENFDCIVMNDFIEHIDNPRKYLGKAYSLLSKGGVIYIATPRADSFMSKFSKGKWLHRKPEQHLYIYTKKNMELMMDECGFKVVCSESIGRIRSIGTIIKKLETYSKGISNFLNGVLPKAIKDFPIKINPLDEMHLVGVKK